MAAAFLFAALLLARRVRRLRADGRGTLAAEAGEGHALGDERNTAEDERVVSVERLSEEDGE